MLEAYLNEMKGGSFVRLGLKKKFEQSEPRGCKKSRRRARSENIEKMTVHLMFRTTDDVIARLTPVIANHYAATASSSQSTEPHSAPQLEAQPGANVLSMSNKRKASEEVKSFCIYSVTYAL